MNIERVFYATTEGGEQVEVTLSSLMNAKWDSSGLLVRTASSLGMVEIKAGSIEDERTNAISAEYDDLLNMYEKDTETLRAELDALLQEREEAAEIHSRIMSEECPSDEYHCTCVPALRQELAEMKTERDALKAEIENLEAWQKKDKERLFAYSTERDALKAAMEDAQKWLFHFPNQLTDSDDILKRYRANNKRAQKIISAALEAQKGGDK